MVAQDEMRREPQDRNPPKKTPAVFTKKEKTKKRTVASKLRAFMMSSSLCGLGFHCKLLLKHKISL